MPQDFSERPSMSYTFEKRSITIELARELVDRALAKAGELGIRVTVAVLDDSGHLKAFARMDGAPLVSGDVAPNKAYTALFGVPSHEFFHFIKDDPALLAGVPHVPRIAAYGGGFPVRVDGAVVGAIGVSGGSVEQDIVCAQAALSALTAGSVAS
jgi:uncharacterized protein GlcG (DUF336 family)